MEKQKDHADQFLNLICLRHLLTCADLIEQFGGHPMAAGLSLPAKNLRYSKKRLQELLLAARCKRRFTAKSYP